MLIKLERRDRVGERERRDESMESSSCHSVTFATWTFKMERSGQNLLQVVPKDFIYWQLKCIIREGEFERG